MKVGIFLGELTASAGGAFTFQESIIEALLDFKSENEFVFFHYGMPPESIRNSGLNLVKLTHRKPGRFAQLFNKPYPLEQALLDYKVHCVWFTIQDCEQVQCPYIYTVWDLQHRNQPWFPEFINTPLNYQKRELHKEFIRKSTGLIVPNETAVQEAQLFYGIPRERIISAHQPTPSFIYKVPPDFSLKYKKPFLLYPAQFWAHKNHFVIIEAIKFLDKKLDYQLDFVFTGIEKGNQWHVINRLKELGLTERVHMPGLISQEQLVGLYDQAQALIYPSLFGPENLPPLEAMARGLPAIVSDVPGAKEQYHNAAQYFDPYSEEDLADKVVQILSNKVLRDQLIKNGKDLAASRSAKQYVQIVDAYLHHFSKIRRNWF